MIYNHWTVKSKNCKINLELFPQTIHCGYYNMLVNTLFGIGTLKIKLYEF